LGVPQVVVRSFGRPSLAPMAERPKSEIRRQSCASSSRFSGAQRRGARGRKC